MIPSLIRRIPLFLALTAVCPAETDVLIYGGTPAGVSAAVSAARQGRSVVLAEPLYYVGGMM
ncbi:MAG: FAD-dependent oxidoreductase, partial [Verrucomicrobiaceae bacterium]